jgi:hypothetical protein
MQVDLDAVIAAIEGERLNGHDMISMHSNASMSRLVKNINALPASDLTQGTWFYPEDGGESPESCPEEVVANLLDWDKCDPGYYTYSIMQARELPNLNVVYQVYTDEEKEALATDEDFAITYYDSAEDARIACEAKTIQALDTAAIVGDGS